MFMGVGAYVGYNYSSWERELLDSVNEARLRRKMPLIRADSIIEDILKKDA